ncbi:hypothetical protein NKK52_24635 [Mesorhizobium sp. C277A]|nr:hypothetical protein [Mesorhizobium sp. LSJC277A00]ESW64402.1 hypothetical protein X771_25960 [Mesorhizobium sp. LSJC277A00]
MRLTIGGPIAGVRHELLGVGDNFKPIVLGLVIVLAVILDAYREKLLRVIR